MEAFAVAYEKSVGVGSRLDVIFDVIRLAFMFGDLKLIKLKVDEAHKYVSRDFMQCFKNHVHTSACACSGTVLCAVSRVLDMKIACDFYFFGLFLPHFPF